MASTSEIKMLQFMSFTWSSHIYVSRFYLDCSVHQSHFPQLSSSLNRNHLLPGCNPSHLLDSSIACLWIKQMIRLSQKRDVAVSAGFCHPACNNNIFIECLSYIGILDCIYIWISTFISAALTTSAIISNVKKKSFDIFLNKYYNPYRYPTLDTSASRM